MVLDDFHTSKAISWDSPKNYIILNLPNAPTHDDDYFHKESDIQLLFEANKSLKSIRSTGHSEPDQAPVIPSESTVQE